MVFHPFCYVKCYFSNLCCLGTKCERLETTYSIGKFSAVHFTVDFKRESGFYVRNLILPNAVLLALTSLVFFLPSDLGDRVGFGVTVTLALCVNLVIVIDFLPETSKTIPDICGYFLTSICLSGLALLCTVCLLNLERMNKGNNINATNSSIR